MYSTLHSDQYIHLHSKQSQADQYPTKLTKGSTNTAKMQTDDQHGSNGPSQPRLDQAYEVAGNPTDKEPIEQSKARQNARAEGEV